MGQFASWGLKGLLYGLIVLMLSACSRPSEPEAEIRAFIAEAQAAAEAHRVGDLRQLIAEDYNDERGNDRKAIENLLRLQILRQQSIHLFTRIDTIELPSPDRAAVRVAVAMVGQPVSRADELINLKADLYRFDLELERRDGAWVARRAQWQPAQIDDFL